MTAKYKNLFFPLLFLFLSFSACVEHRIHIDILPDGTGIYKYSGRGDQADLYDLDFPLPKGGLWKIQEYKEQKEDQTIFHYDASARFNNASPIASSFYDGNEYPNWVFVSHPLEVESGNYFFFRKYHLSQRFENRMISAKYPGFRQLLDEKNKSNIWAYDILSYLFSASLDSVLRTYKGENLPDVQRIEGVRKSVNNLLLDRIESMEEEITPDNWKRIVVEGRRTLFGSLGIDSTEALATQFSRHFHNLEQEARINTLLRDDIFYVSLTMPGRQIKPESQSVKGDTLSWKFDLRDFMDKDFVIQARSVLIYWKRVISLGVIFLFILIFAGTRLFRSV